MFKKILYINSPRSDFLSDSFLIGLKQLYGDKVIELPLNPYIYKKSDDSVTAAMHGKGFTLYNLLDSNTGTAYSDAVNLKDVDLFIFGDIHRQSSVYLQLLPYLNFKNTIILDGEDTPGIYPYYFLWKKPKALFLPKPHKRHLYFKREIVPNRINYYLRYKLVPKFLAAHLKLHQNILPISFSIPDKKIIKGLPEKKKLFTKHIVDEEIAVKVEGALTRHPFDNETDYYQDLQISKFGITTKRNGWDCLRHYEIAANGAVICFKQLQNKPSQCAPHDLIIGVNCLCYQNYDDLMQQINSISEKDYKKLQENSLNWVKTKSCEYLVNKTLELWKSKIPDPMM
jgi:hypothetical protein